jgi:histidine triad (HIT) family protein
MEGCVFCAIVAGEAPAEILWRGEESLAFLDIHPAAPGHTLIIPCRHFSDFDEMDEVIGAAVMGLALRMARLLRKVLRPDGLSLVHSTGQAAGQEVPHTHLHLIPRWFGDGLALGRPLVVREEQPLSVMARRLRDGLEMA